MNKKMYIIIAVSLVFVFGIGIILGASQGFTNWNAKEWFSKEDNQAGVAKAANMVVMNDSSGGEYVFEMKSTPKMYLSMGEETLACAGDAYPTRTLTATVLPDSALDKAVDWSIYWADNASRASQTVSDYVAIEPNGDGSNIAAVTCYQSFEGDFIIINVTTRSGGFNASCVVSYKGVPDSIAIDTKNFISVHDTAWNTDVIEMYSNGSYLLPISMDNALHQVGSSFASNYAISMSVHGSVNTRTDTFDSSGTSTGTNYGQNELKYYDFWESAQYCNSYFSVSGGLVTHVNASIENGQLKIETGNAVESLYGFGAGRGGSAKMYFDSYIDNKIPYTTVTITETSTGISHSINIRLIASVQSVALSDSTLTF